MTNPQPKLPIFEDRFWLVGFMATSRGLFCVSPERSSYGREPYGDDSTDSSRHQHPDSYHSQYCQLVMQDTSSRVMDSTGNPSKAVLIVAFSGKFNYQWRALSVNWKERS